MNKDFVKLDKSTLQKTFQAAVDHAQFKIDEARKTLEKPTLNIEELQRVSRVLDQLAAITTASEPASYDCVG